MPGTFSGPGAAVAAARQQAERTQEQNDLLFESYLELKIITLHLAEIAGARFDQEDIELETN